MFEIPVEFWAIGITTGLSMITLGLGAQYQYWKKKAFEFSEALYTTMKALEDDKITKEEMQDIIKEWKELIL